MSEFQKQTGVDKSGNPVYASSWKKRKSQKSGSKGAGRQSMPSSGSNAMFPNLNDLTIKVNKRGG